ncbi:GNAT family N-acetyltransferase [Chitinophaga vietnamensis]|uniref:GNAT family N-acetyltransferase n=1 Tax=Chitinophaga vietnamensis TaxID=2593957 RepID=UPI0011779FD4|nr:GNAT family N-acetyltransferase [Chitinophaga vietnamensis]
MEQGIYATVVTNNDELQQIAALSKSNNTTLLSATEKARDGFLTWSYDTATLQRLHHISPSVIVKDGDTVAGYAIVLTKEGATVYPPLQAMLAHLEQIEYEGKTLNDYHFYVMGQVCVHPDYRGKGVFQLLYEHHRTLFAQQYDFLVTEISVHNHRSLRAHQRTGFRTIHTYKDELSTWDVVIWDWA